ncbi:MAG: IS1634 family transposase [Desulfomonile tiedjei]|uniref:IS1634 family transposase n=1 Tax=Desulfomonile tiedjei TaxID=2358 RepID=A0A9D6Z5Z7_9BACT|nr:IS1634 family transposase [Desulfomonile tiedjei]
MYETHLLRRTFREEGKVKHETVGNISHLPLDVIDVVRRALKGEIFSGAQEDFQIERSLPHGHVAAALGMIRKLDLEAIISQERCRERDLVLGMIVSRLLAPSSKLATARGLGVETLSTSLGDILGITSAEVAELYGAMDWLIARQAEIEDALAARHLHDGSLVLYDATSVYVEGRKSPLARFGHNRDEEKGKLQIVFGLLCTTEGCPVAVEVFEGNTADPKTLASQIAKLRTRFGLSRVVIVGDRGMITEARLKEDFRPEEGVEWITALRAPAIRKLVQNGSLQLSLFDETDLAEISDPDYPGERLIVCKNPLLGQEKARKREDLLQATEKKLGEIVEATMRQSRRLKGKERIALRVGKILNRFKVAKHFRIEIEEESFRYCRNHEAIAQESSLDGIYIIRTSVPADAMAAANVVRAYKGLSRAERAFMSLKSIDLKVRPIFHWVSDRVKSHILICMLAYYVEWHMRAALAPMLFGDHDRAGAEALRKSVVAPAQRTSATKIRIRGLASDGLPVHSFQSLMADLGTLTKNRVHVKNTGATFELYATPTLVQNRAFDLLGISPRL